MTEDRLERYRCQAGEFLLSYLEILEQQHRAITGGETDRLEDLLREGAETLSSLESVQRVCVAWEREPGRVPPDGARGDARAGVQRAEMETLLARAREQQRTNEELLRNYRDDLGRRITELQVPRQGRSVFAPPPRGGRSIDLTR
ncbi:hypothetical protein AU468_02425 [Alkalispirochaeta sphaeroplastigenens]|uniref:Flagellar biosynthesis protein FlgN n=1 Tax=Alkalispirochaeta sphaeroplastigenens TaxID=1187066 RepID=A0A2S4JZ39_9SPIO|nr:flagellar export chaperone FlgN [Alkalispirochaeta sphaeroplastigenens]POR04771.1 hypothetical protein AU468_02425 [Alkalispirochaeta sphaeroplastigenens]